MAFAAAEQGHHGAPLTGLRHQEQRVVGSTASLQRRSRRQRWAAPSCMLALLAWHSCIVAAAKRMSAALGRARSAPSHRAWHACMMDLFHTTGTYFLSHLVVVYGCQCHRELCSCW